MEIVAQLVLVAALCLGCGALEDVERLPPPVCASDIDCDDGALCNGPERCDPESPIADGLGCVPSDLDPADDQIPCTRDFCDEALDVITHDPADCECSGDRQCPAPAGAPCMVGVCTPMFTCALAERGEMEPCEDGIACTTGERCVMGSCTRPPGAEGLDASVCDDGAFCNGAESCDPTSASPDPFTGCAPGVPPVELIEQQDAFPCTVELCDEESDAVYSDSSTCECSAPSDCKVVMGAPCRTFACDAETGWLCREVGFVAEGEACDDGVECTAGDSCDAAGVCVGAPLDILCVRDDACAGRCQPGEGADVDGCRVDLLPRAPGRTCGD